jgi:flagellar hook-basal body complex protein FliE
MIEATAALGAALSELQSLAGAATSSFSSSSVTDITGAADSSSPSFAQALHSALGSLDSAVATANSNAHGFASGDQSIPLSDVMVSMEQANLAMQMASGVRDKVVAAYSNIMNMQV